MVCHDGCSIKMLPVFVERWCLPQEHWCNTIDSVSSWSFTRHPFQPRSFIQLCKCTMIRKSGHLLTSFQIGWWHRKVRKITWASAMDDWRYFSRPSTMQTRAKQNSCKISRVASEPHVQAILPDLDKSTNPETASVMSNSGLISSPTDISFDVHSAPQPRTKGISCILLSAIGMYWFIWI